MKIRWTLEKLQIEADKYQTRGTFQKNSPKAYDAAHGRKLLDIICKHMAPSLRKPYTKEELQLEANRYNTRGDFKKGNEAAYQAAWKRNDFEQICNHMAVPKNKAYTHVEIFLEAKKYKTRSEFINGNYSSYNAARRMKILEQVCEHMKYSAGTSKEERKLFMAIKDVYPSSKKLRKMKISIPGKPYIKGFDIDIYIPELQKGIEFDGAYYHSFDRLKKSRPRWPDKDISNYHQIKDNYFLSKGIKILHIKDEEWFLNKELCIKKCLDFLSKKV